MLFNSRQTHSVEHFLGQADGHVYLDPVLRGRAVAVALLDPVAREPCVDGVHALRMGAHERLDVLLGQVRAVARVRGVAHLVQVRLELAEPGLREGDAEGDGVVRGGRGEADPVAGDGDALFEARGVVWGGVGEGREDDGGEDEHGGGCWGAATVWGGLL